MPRRPPKPPDRPSVPRHRSQPKTEISILPAKKAKTLNDLMKQAPRGHYQALHLILALTSESDRAAAIVGGAFLDHALKEAIASRLANNDENTKDKLFDDAGAAPLTSFDAKIRIGYALGLFGPVTRGDLNRVRKIRNTFAHSLARITFETRAVSNVCVFEVLRRTDLEAAFDKLPPHVNRKRYVFAILFLCLGLYGVTVYEKKKNALPLP